MDSRKKKEKKIMDAEKNNKKKEKSYKVTKYSRETEIGPHNADFGPYSHIWLN